MAKADITQVRRTTAGQLRAEIEGGFGRVPDPVASALEGLDDGAALEVILNGGIRDPETGELIAGTLFLVVVGSDQEPHKWEIG